MARLVKEIGSRVIIDILEGTDPVELDRIHLHYILFIGIVKVEEFQDADIPFHILVQHFVIQPLEIGGEFGVDGPEHPLLGKSFLQGIRYIFFHRGLGIALGGLRIRDQCFRIFDIPLVTVEDGQLQELLVAMGIAEKSDRQHEFDAAVTRMRPAVQTIWKAKEQALLLANSFTARNQQKQVFAAIEQMMAADLHVSSWENTLLRELRMKFRL